MVTKGAPTKCEPLAPSKIDRGRVMLSQTAVYALRASAFLASRHPSPCTTQQISHGTLVPKPYLSKIVRALVRRGVMRSQRGHGGGIALARSPADINLFEIVNSLENRSKHNSTLTEPAPHSLLGGLEREMREIRECVKQRLAAKTLAQLYVSPRCNSVAAPQSERAEDAG